MSTSNPDATWVPLAEIARPHGVQGELRLRLFNADSDLLLDVDEVLLRLTDGKEHEVSVDRARRADDAILMRLHSVNDRNRADELRGAQVCVRRSNFPKLDEGEFYVGDILGARVSLGENQSFGIVKDYRNYPSVDVFVIQVEGGLLEVPNREGYVLWIDAQGGEVALESIEGLELEPQNPGRASREDREAEALRLKARKSNP